MIFVHTGWKPSRILVRTLPVSSLPDEKCLPLRRLCSLLHYTTLCLGVWRGHRHLHRLIVRALTGVTVGNVQFWNWLRCSAVSRCTWCRSRHDTCASTGSDGQASGKAQVSNHVTQSAVLTLNQLPVKYHIFKRNPEVLLFCAVSFVNVIAVAFPLENHGMRAFCSPVRGDLNL